MDELTAACRKVYKDSEEDLLTIDEFQRNYGRHSPIWWYTRECFTYRMLNQALRNQDVDLLIKMGFFLRDVHRQIEKLHSRGCISKKRFIVYRGQGLSTSNFEKIKSSRGGLISFNSFLSTSFDEQVSTDFARPALRRVNTVGVLFRMAIDPSISTIPFGSLDNISYYDRREKELLFSMHTVFRIGDVQSIDAGLWKINLTLCSDTEDEKLHRLTKAMREQTTGSTPWHQLARILLETGDYEKAKDMYRVMLDGALKTKKDQELSHMYNQLGFIEVQRGEYSKALEYHHKALDIRVKSLPPTHPNLATSYSNIGGVYDSMGEYSKALEYHHKALDIGLKSLKPEHLGLGGLYRSLAISEKNRGNLSEALRLSVKAIKIAEKSVSPRHPRLGFTYNKLAEILEANGELEEAGRLCTKALGIQEKTLSEHHPDLATTVHTLGSIKMHQNSLSEAMEHYQRALKMRKTSLPAHHQDIAASHFGIGCVHEKMGDLGIARASMKLAIKIAKSSLPSTHPLLQTYKDALQRGRESF